MNPPPVNQNRRAWWADVLAKYDRIAVVGGPRVGKTTLTRQVKGRPVIHTDDFKREAWDAAPFSAIAEVHNATAGQERKRFVIEGTRAGSCLSRGLEVDAVVVLTEPLEPLTTRQECMRKAVISKLATWYSTHKDVPMLQAPPIPESEREAADVE